MEKGQGIRYLECKKPCDNHSINIYIYIYTHTHTHTHTVNQRNVFLQGATIAKPRPNPTLTLTLLEAINGHPWL